MNLRQGAPRAAFSIAASALAYSMSWYLNERQALAYGLSFQQLAYDLLLLALGPVIISIIAVAVLAVSKSIWEGLAVALMPLAAGWAGPLSLLEATLSTLVSAISAAIAALALRLLARGQLWQAPALNWMGLSPLPLSLASVALAVETALSAPWLPAPLWSQAVYAAACLASALLASAGARRTLSVAGGLLSSLGPLGLVIVLELNRLTSASPQLIKPTSFHTQQEAP